MLENIAPTAGENPSPAAFVDAAGSDLAPAVPQVRYKGIAICGSNPHNKLHAPFGDEGWLIYACSPDNSPAGAGPGAGPLPRVDVFFEVHVPVFDRSRPYPYLDWLRNAPQVYMRDAVAAQMRAADGQPLFPNAIAYPEARLRGMFCPFLFSSSIAFMMAKAIVDAEELGIKQIGLWGILQSSKTEYEKQRAGTQYFIWEATRRGIKVLAARESGLFELPPEDF
jgi:hypothetical protein